MCGLMIYLCLASLRWTGGGANQPTKTAEETVPSREPRPPLRAAASPLPGHTHTAVWEHTSAHVSTRQHTSAYVATTWAHTHTNTAEWGHTAMYMCDIYSSITVHIYRYIYSSITVHTYRYTAVVQHTRTDRCASTASCISLHTYRYI